MAYEKTNWTETTPITTTNLNKIEEGIYQAHENDTGWVDMSGYINEGFAARDDAPPMARKISNKVYWKGAVYCTQNQPHKVVDVMLNLPEWCVTAYEYGGGSIQYDIGTPYMIFIESNRSIKVYSQGDIVSTEKYSGYSLTNISGYLID